MDLRDPAGFRAEASFRSAFDEIYTYYAECRLMALRRVGPLFLMVFAIGERDDDIRVLRWRIDTEAPIYIAPYGAPHPLSEPTRLYSNPPICSTTGGS